MTQLEELLIKALPEANETLDELEEELGKELEQIENHGHDGLSEIIKTIDPQFTHLMGLFQNAGEVATRFNEILLNAVDKQFEIYKKFNSRKE